MHLKQLQFHTFFIIFFFLFFSLPTHVTAQNNYIDYHPIEIEIRSGIPSLPCRGRFVIRGGQAEVTDEDYASIQVRLITNRAVEANILTPNSQHGETVSIEVTQAGIYEIIVTDALGCIGTAEIELADCPSVEVLAPYQLVAPAEDFCIDITTRKFTNILGLNFRLSWSDSIIRLNEITNIHPSIAGATNIFNDSNNGNITFTWQETMDLNAGTSIEESPEIIIISSLSVTTAISCNDDSPCDGTATIQGAYSDGRSGNFSFTWENGEFNEDTNIGIATALCKGFNKVTITDENDCSTVDSIFITAPEQLLFFSSIVTPSPNGGTDGSISIFPNGGTPDYTIEWSDGALGSVNENLAAGIYTITVTDANECTFTSTVELEDVRTEVPCDDNFYKKNNLPFHLTPCGGEVELLIINRWGQVIYQEIHPQAAQIELPELQPFEIHYYLLRTEDGVMQKGRLNLLRR